MKNLLKLLSILQLTKEQPVSGYLPAGIKAHEMPNLAAHHYNTTLIGYFLTQKIKQAGGKINERKLLLMLLIHDLSELFGGDVAGPLNRKYPDLREHKDKIGERTFEMLGEFMDGLTKEEFNKLWNEFEFGSSDETIVGKICDQMDHQFFLEHHNYKQKYSPGAADYRDKFTHEHIYKLIKKIQDPKTKKVLEDFINEWKENFFNQGYQAITFLMNNEE